MSRDIIFANTGFIGGWGTIESSSAKIEATLRWFTSPFVSNAIETMQIKQDDVYDNLYLSKGFTAEIEKVKRDFQSNPNDFKKFPEINDDAWK